MDQKSNQKGLDKSLSTANLGEKQHMLLFLLNSLLSTSHLKLKAIALNVLLKTTRLLFKVKQFNACNHQRGKATAASLFPVYFQNNKQTVELFKRNRLVKRKTVKCLQGETN